MKLIGKSDTTSSMSWSELLPRIQRRCHSLTVAASFGPCTAFVVTSFVITQRWWVDDCFETNTDTNKHMAVGHMSLLMQLFYFILLNIFPSLCLNVWFRQTLLIEVCRTNTLLSLSKPLLWLASFRNTVTHFSLLINQHRFIFVAFQREPQILPCIFNSRVVSEQA